MRIHFFTAPFGWSGRQREGWGLPSGVIAASHVKSHSDCKSN